MVYIFSDIDGRKCKDYTYTTNVAMVSYITSHENDHAAIELIYEAWHYASAVKVSG